MMRNALAARTLEAQLARVKTGIADEVSAVGFEPVAEVEARRTQVPLQHQNRGSEKGQRLCGNR